jgi:DNA-binding NarL/FixJ family response regulator
MKNKIQIFLVDDHEIFRQGLKFVLNTIERLEVIGEASSGEEFLDKLNLVQPDVVLMDISLPCMDGIQTTEIALSRFPQLKIICLSGYGDEVYYYKMIKAGAMGFVQKKSGKEELEKSIDSVVNGDNYFPGELLSHLLFKISTKGLQNLSGSEINVTEREKQVLILICQGYSNNEIAEKLFLSPKTIDNHRTNLLSKTATRNSAHLVMYAIKHKLVEL